ncbi:MAG TPA: peptidylprolyl isomerase [Kofleriaceae bacterium]|jgi:peptidyl-prolyl cis-trans isomerase A (cyclophilin A)|nr:peptidylprolyl isomerase [Kofleriaceae bacterium]
MHHFRTVLFGLAVVLALGACENTPKPKDTPKPVDPAIPAKPDPNALPTQPKPDPTPASDVGPPLASDLALYTKDLPGTGQKLLMTMDTSLGTFHCELYGDKAPMTVANWIGLATGKKPWLNPKTGNVERGKPYFDGLIFHRVIPGFMVQGGDPLGQGFGGPGYQFNDEIWQGQHVGAGVLAMANAGVRGGQGTNGSQFFIMEGDRPDLDSKHTVFGKCNEVDLIKKIEGVPRDENDKPNDPVSITKVTITKG